MRKQEKTFNLDELYIGLVYDESSPLDAGYTFLKPASKRTTQTINIMLFKEEIDEERQYDCYHPALCNFEILIDEYNSEDFSKKLTNTMSWEKFRCKYYRQLQHILPRKKILSYDELNHFQFDMNETLRIAKAKEYIDSINKKNKESDFTL